MCVRAWCGRRLGGREQAVCPKGKTLNLKFEMHEITAVSAMILYSVAQMRQRCTADCCYG
jgi:hypothetical protein